MPFWLLLLAWAFFGERMRGSPGTLAVPVVGVLAAWLQLGERPTAAEAVGIGLILAGLMCWPRRGVRTAGREPAVRPASRSRQPEQGP